MENMKDKVMKNVFIAGDGEQLALLKKHLEKQGIKCDDNSFICYNVIEVEKKDYVNALKSGVDFLFENDLSKSNVCAINAYDERQAGTTGSWSVAYCSMNRKKFRLDETEKDENENDRHVVSPRAWFVCDIATATGKYDGHAIGWKEWVEHMKATTPAEIMKMYGDLERITGHKFVSVYNHVDGALELKAICMHEEHEIVKSKVLKYLDQNRIFDKVTPQELTGLLQKELTKDYTKQAKIDAGKIPQIKKAQNELKPNTIED